MKNGNFFGGFDYKTICFSPLNIFWHTPLPQLYIAISIRILGIVDTFIIWDKMDHYWTRLVSTFCVWIESFLVEPLLYSFAQHSSVLYCIQYYNSSSVLCIVDPLNSVWIQRPSIPFFVFVLDILTSLIWSQIPRELI